MDTGLAFVNSSWLLLHESVAVVLGSGKSADVLEGHVALLLITTLQSLEPDKYAPGPVRGTMHSNYDLQTQHAIYEVTEGDGQGKVTQLITNLVNDAYGPQRTPPEPVVPIVIYDPTISGGMPDQTVRNIFNTVQSVNTQLKTNIVVYVINASGEWCSTAVGNGLKGLIEATDKLGTRAEQLLQKLIKQLEQIIP